ncbi:hypothetical protein C8Q75DRAFT_714346 [Abortiporus biennis]|nr:hypothetical protein C8Q75DRAFT_714346 [Abortiporus biennis]
MRQVVDEVRADTEARKFAEDIRKACWTVRFGEIPLRPKTDRNDSQNTMGSSLHLPFISSTSSLPNAMNFNVANVPGLRRPPSVQSLALPVHTMASVTQIARALTSMASVNRPRTLPHESLVLSALLVPFLSPRDGTPVDTEQATAIETFEYAIRTWKAPSNEGEVDRCLWCCKAASVRCKMRPRILSTLSNLLFPKDKKFFANTPILIQTVVQSILSLMYTLSSAGEGGSEILTLSRYITAIRAGDSGPLSKSSIEKEYGVRFGKGDNEDALLEAIVTEAAINCLELGPEASRRWILHHVIEDQWRIPEPNLTLTPLLVCVYWRKLKTFIGSILTLISSSAYVAEEDGEILVRLFRSRILPEVEALAVDDAAEIQTSVVRLVLELLCIEESSEQDYIMMHFCDWYQNQKDWKASIDTTVTTIIMEAEWPVVLRLIPNVTKELPDEIRVSFVSFVVPLIYERLVHELPDLPCHPLSNFLQKVSVISPKVFFKPLFTCAASTKDATVVKQLCILNAVAKILPDLWTRDPEMMSVALMSDPASAVKNKTTTVTWGKPRLGQSVLALELVENLRSIRQGRDNAATVGALKFASALDQKLGILIEIKEQTTLIPQSQRILLCALFREIRLLTRSLKSASWLSSVVSWCTGWQVNETSSPDGTADDVASSMNKLKALYLHAQDTSYHHKRKATVLALPIVDKQSASQSHESVPLADIREEYTERIERLNQMSAALKTAGLELLVSISGLLHDDDYRHMLTMLWTTCMDSHEANIIAPACFLLMQCAEKVPDDFTRLVELDLSSTGASTRLKALRRIGALASWRFQLLSQEVILDRSHRRPFKSTRPPILFVATDIGSSLYVYEEDPDEYKNSSGQVLPLELRRRLSEIGWSEENKQVDERTQWIRTPMALLPSQQLDRLDHSNDEQPTLVDSRSPSPEPTLSKSTSGDTSLVRRDSSASLRSHGVKRRPVFVPALASMFPRFAALVADSDYAVSNAALDLILDFMRDDPALLARSAFHLLTGDAQSVSSAVTTLRAFLHVQHTLPPAMAHHLLNHLTGYLKSSMRHTENSASLMSYAYSIPIIADVVWQVSKMSIREIRRAKVDQLLIPTGCLWFPANAPTGPLFPRSVGYHNNPFETLPEALVYITMVRNAQTRLFLSMLKRNPQDVNIIRKNMSRLVLPGMQGKRSQDPIPLVETIPRKRDPASQPPSQDERTISVLSLTLSRSYLLLVAQIFQSMSRHLNDRTELHIHMDGINRILLTHGDDIGIVAHSMIALMIASTRFRRLFTSGGGYTLFMPAVVKAYVEAEYHPGIRGAIEYACSRFYALHQDSFVFQTMDVLSHVVTLPTIDEPWVGKGIYSLFLSLSSGSPTTVDYAAIHGLNRVHEKEALMISLANEIPQTFLASLKKANNPGTPQDKADPTVPIPDEYEKKRLSMDNLVRLFLTVIAHNPAIQRAENFLQFLRILAPYLYQATNATRVVLKDGIVALGNILLSKSGNKGKNNESQLQSEDTLNYEVFAGDTSAHAHTQGSTTSDLLAMRLNYLSLVVAYTRAGGQFGHTASLRMMDIVKLVLKESRTNAERIGKFMSDYARTSLIRDPPPSVKPVTSLLGDLAPIVSAYHASVDFSGVFDVVAELAGDPMFGNERSFAQIAVFQYCRIGLDACELAASENLISHFTLRNSLIKLMNHAVSMVGGGIMTELQSRDPTYHFLSSVILPFTLTLKTSADILAVSQLADTWRRDTHSQAWIQLLTYVLSACQKVDDIIDSKSQSSQGVEGRKSEDDTQSDPAVVMAFAMALQLLKIVIIRAEDDIATASPGLWVQIGSILSSALSDGDGSFAFKTADYSEPPSPSFSPRASAFPDQPQQSIFQFPSSISMHSRRRPLSPPRMIDYLAWSFIQWLWLRRNPLMLQMRIFAQARIAHLAEELYSQNGPSSYIGSARTPVASSPFSKPRRSMVVHSAPSSAASTPRSSTYLGGLPSVPSFGELDPSTSTPRKERQAGYALTASPSTPSRRSSQLSNGPKIVHLGPVTPGGSNLNGMYGISVGGRPSSLNGGNSSSSSNRNHKTIRSLAREMTIRSSTLVRSTYRRIRLVQHLMGYRELLPLGSDGPFGGDDDGDDPDSDIKWWTRRDAIEAIVQETRDLIEEYQENYGSGSGDYSLNFADESMVVVESDMTPQESTTSLLGHSL